MLSTDVFAVDTEVELIAANAKWPGLRYRVIGGDTTADEEEEQEEGDQFMGPYSSHEIVYALEDRAKDGFGEPGGTRLACASPGRS